MKRIRYILCLIVCATVASCAVQPVTRVADVGDLEARAAAEIGAGNLAAAAQLYRRLADGTSGPVRAGYLITAAELLLQSGDRMLARQWLDEAGSAADEEQRKQILVLTARLELDAGNAELALQTLDRVATPVPVELMVAIGAIRGQALFSLGRHAEAVRVLVEREVWLDDGDAILANQRLIWDSLRAADPRVAPQPSGDRIVDGWLALAPVSRLFEDPIEFRRALLDWRSVYVEHPAAGGLLAELLSERRQARDYPAQIALLLPMSSPQREAAIAIRDGFFAAHLQSGRGRESTIRVYDTAELGAQEAYLRAQLEGADFVVGPLFRPNVEQVIVQSGFVPTLTLNFSQGDTPFVRSIHQFALAPEDEARAVAQRAYAEGARTAIAIIASNDWGYRVLDSFRTEFEALGGRLLDFAGYAPNVQDFSAQITTLLNISQSRQRHQRLAANLGLSLEFEARRRQDVDMIVLGADTARAGRLLAPQLRFYNAGDIPTYATSAVYEPGSQQSDADLNGVIFPDAPLLVAPDNAASFLSRELAAHWPRRAPQLMRFYGMGFDAYGLMGGLYGSREQLWPMPGLSGMLSADAAGRIRRDLPFAQFQNGRPVPLVSDRPVDRQIIGLR